MPESQPNPVVQYELRQIFGDIFGVRRRCTQQQQIVLCWKFGPRCVGILVYARANVSFGSLATIKESQK